MSREAQSNLERRVVAAAEAALARSGSVSPIDVLTGLGWLHGRKVDEWRQGRAGHLEHALTARPDRLAAVRATLRRWAEERELRPSEMPYLSAARDRASLRFTASGDEAAERAYRTHWLSPDLSEARRARLVARQSKPPDLQVVEPLKEWTCVGCHGTGDLLILEDGKPTCLTCAELDHLVFLPAGDAALTRRAKAASGLAAVVVRLNRRRKRYERRGLLVEEAALDAAERQCLADEDARARRRERDRERRADEDLELQARTAREIRRIFPGCPPERAEAIARHTAVRGSGRVGRSAAGRALDETAVSAAVVASVRHEDTGYDALLMSGVPRADARERIRADVDGVLDRWRG
ncbi:DUF2293 domain-containing protein [Actinoallomurus bryophytorum]|uniref:DUF2293 domain-containing protein n=1 Tax=Actinoallomurus bryophytorum TaxID=1490222 RepID=A0A543C140_9ACTN|nr:DUF2293 domain-containing protein [Actinoallomurus bryophytorum]TQL90797.1 hypothetical protein FB559_8110 [Actinoallomurus bryophytorum]